MKPFFIIFLLSFIISTGCTSQREIVKVSSFQEHDLDKNIYLKNKVTIDDVIHYLHQVPALSCYYENSQINLSNGIVIKLILDDNLPKDGQSFKLVSHNKILEIYGQYPHGFTNGLYYLMEQFGFRWYMPGDAWTMVPKRLSKFKNNNVLITPDFRDRSFFGTGGWGEKKDYDPNFIVQKEYRDWTRRNRINVTYADKGHSGIAYWNQNKNYLKEHPEFFCSGKAGVNELYNLSQPKLVDLIVTEKTKSLNTPYLTIGMDPHDGSGTENDCLDGPNGKFDHYADKYFWLANQVAKVIPDNKDIKVTIYAYSNHADIPNINLDSNIFPIIIPYAFQRVAAPKQYIESWSKKMGNREMGIYDYWNITQWSKSLPQFNILEIEDKLRFWKRNNINSIYLESTYSKGPMGHALYLFSKMSWDVDQDMNKIFDEFLKNCFDRAAPDVKRMYLRWSKDFGKSIEAAESMEDLKRAESKTQNPQVLQRLEELKGYIIYMDKYYNYMHEQSSSNYSDLVGYMQDIHPLGLIQTTALIDYYIPKMDINPQIKRQLPFQRINQETARIQKPTYSRSKVTKVDQIFQVRPCKEANLKHYIIGPNRYEFDILQDGMNITFDMWTMKEAYRAIIYDQNQNVVKEFLLQPNSDSDHLTQWTVLLNRGSYTLHFGKYYQKSLLKWPKELLVRTSTKWYDNGSYPPIYVVVPSDVEAIVYIDGNGPGTNGKGYWISPKGKRIEPQHIKGKTYKVTLPPNRMKNEVWKFVVGHGSFEFLNIEDKFFTSCVSLD